MPNLITDVAQSISKNLLSSLPKEFATKFSLEESQVREFVQEYLTSQVGKAATKGRTPAPKGRDGKGKVTGYILYSNEHRQQVRDETPDIKFSDTGKKLGEMWKALTPEQRASWNDKAAQHNLENGLESKAKASPKVSSKSVDKAKKEPGMKVVKHPGSNAWIIEGTTFTVQSTKNKTVNGKLRGDKVVALSATDVKKCQELGYSVAPAPAAKKTTPAAKKTAPVQKGKQPSAQESDDEDSE